MANRSYVSPSEAPGQWPVNLSVLFPSGPRCRTSVQQVGLLTRSKIKRRCADASSGDSASPLRSGGSCPSVYLGRRHNSFRRAACCYNSTLTAVLDSRTGHGAQGDDLLSPVIVNLLILPWLLSLKERCFCSMTGRRRKKMKRVAGCFAAVLPPWFSISFAHLH